jgi:hypothetical protein
MKISIDQQKYAILKAIEFKLISATKIDPNGKGKGITRLKQGNASTEAIQKTYQSLIQQVPQKDVENLLKDYPCDQQVKKVDNKAEATSEQSTAKPKTPATQPAEVKKLQAELKAAQAKIAELEAENKELKEKVEKLTKDEPIKIEGWSLVQRKAGGGDHLYWYAGKSICGKMQWIYIGKELDLKEARAKIESEQEKKKNL